MPIRVSDNSAQQLGLRITDLTRQQTAETLTRIASGLRINRAADDAAGLGISERLRALSNGFRQVEDNLQAGVSALQVAEGGISSIQDTVQRLRELTIQAANDTLTDEDRSVIQAEVDQLVAEIDRQAGSVQFNGQPLLSGQYSAANGGFTIQAGANEGETLQVNIEQVNASTLNLAGLDVSSRASAESALGRIDTALQTINGQRATLGSYANRLESSLSFVGIARENTQAALSQVRDANLAQEAVGLSLLQIRNQSGLAAVSQGNIAAQSALRLLGA